MAAQKSVIVFNLNDLNNNTDFNYLSKSLPKSLLVTLNNSSGFNSKGYDSQKKQIDFKEALLLADQNRCDIAILGNFIVVRGNIQINLEAVDVKTKRVKIAESVSGKADKEIFDLIDEIIKKMSEKMVKNISKEKDAVKIREKTSVEEIYFSGSRKDQWFYTSLGMLSHNIKLQGETKQSSVEGNVIVPIVGLGYGYKFGRLFLYGTPPLFKGLNEDHIKKADLNSIFMAGIEWKLIKNKLYTYSEIDSIEDTFNIELTWLNQSSSWETSIVDYHYNAVFFTTGIRYTAFKGLSAVLKAGFPISSHFYFYDGETRINKKAKWQMLFYSSIIWKFSGSAGIKAEFQRYSTQTAEDMNPEKNAKSFRLSNSTAILSFFYEMDF